MDHIVEKLILTGIGAVLGVALKTGFDHTLERLWRLRSLSRFWSFLEERCVVLIPTKPPRNNEWGPAIGYGDGAALSEIQVLGNKLFPAMPELIVSENNRIEELRDQNLIVIGGGKYNSAYRKLINELRPAIHFFDTETEDFKDIRNSNRTVVFSPEYKNGKLVSDLGLILRCRRQSTQKTVLIMAGSHTYGSWAAAKYLTASSNVRVLNRYISTGFELVIRSSINGNQISPAKPESNVRRFGEGVT